MEERASHTPCRRILIGCLGPGEAWEELTGVRPD